MTPLPTISTKEFAKTQDTALSLFHFVHSSTSIRKEEDFHLFSGVNRYVCKNEMRNDSTTKAHFCTFLNLSFSRPDYTFIICFTYLTSFYCLHLRSIHKLSAFNVSKLFLCILVCFIYDCMSI